MTDMNWRIPVAVDHMLDAGVLSLSDITSGRFCYQLEHFVDIELWNSAYAAALTVIATGASTQLSEQDLALFNADEGLRTAASTAVWVALTHIVHSSTELEHAEVAVSATPKEPAFHGDHQAWKDTISIWKDIAGPLTGNTSLNLSDRAVAVARTVFYTAAEYNTLFYAPLDAHLSAWARIFDCSDFGHGQCMEWLTPDLAQRAVCAHFSSSKDGEMAPGHVIQQAELLRIEKEINK